MTDEVKLSELTSAGDARDGDEVPTVRGGRTVTVTLKGSGAEPDAFPKKATSTDVTGATNDTNYMTVLKTFQAIARRVKNATASVAGIVRLATPAEDSAGTATNVASTPSGVDRYLRKDDTWNKIGGKPDGIAPSLITNVFTGETTTGPTATEITGSAPENSTNIGYVIEVAGETKFVLGSDLYAIHAGNAITVNDVVIYTPTDGDNLHYLQTTGAAKSIEVWVINDIAAIRAAVEIAESASEAPYAFYSVIPKSHHNVRYQLGASQRVDYQSPVVGEEQVVYDYTWDDVNGNSHNVSAAHALPTIAAHDPATHQVWQIVVPLAGRDYTSLQTGIAPISFNRIDKSDLPMMRSIFVGPLYSTAARNINSDYEIPNQGNNELVFTVGSGSSIVRKKEDSITFRARRSNTSLVVGRVHFYSSNGNVIAKHLDAGNIAIQVWELQDRPIFDEALKLDPPVLPQKITPKGTGVTVGTVGTGQSGVASTAIPLQSLGDGEIASNLNATANTVNIKAGSYILAARITNVNLGGSNTRSNISLWATGLPDGSFMRDDAVYARGGTSGSPRPAINLQTRIYLPTDGTGIQIKLALPQGVMTNPAGYTAGVTEIYLIPLGGAKGPKGDKGDPGNDGDGTVDATARAAAAAAQATANAALPKAGGTMTGKIVLDGDPSADLDAVPKQYVDRVAGSDGDTAFIHETFNGEVGDGSSGASSVGDITIQDDDDYLYWIKVTKGNADASAAVVGDELYNSASNNHWRTLASVGVYTTASGVLRITKSDTQVAYVQVWQMRNAPAFDAMVEQVDPTRFNEGEVSAIAALPDATEREVGEMFMREDGSVWRVYASPDGSADQYRGIVEQFVLDGDPYIGTSLEGQQFGWRGQFTVNPGGVIGSLTVGGEGYTSVQVRVQKAAYETAKGSAVASGDTVNARITAHQQTTTTTLTYDEEDNGYLKFVATDSGSALHFARSGDSWALKILDSSDDSEMLEHAEGVKHYNQFSLDVQDTDARQELDTAIELAVTHGLDAARLAGEVRTSRGVVVTAIPTANIAAPDKVFLTRQWEGRLSIPAASRWNDRTDMVTTAAGSIKVRYPGGEYQKITGTADLATIEVGVEQVDTTHYYGFVPESMANRLWPGGTTVSGKVGERKFDPIGVGLGAVVELDAQTGADSLEVWIEKTLWESWFPNGYPGEDDGVTSLHPNSVQLHVEDGGGTVRKAKVSDGGRRQYIDGVQYIILQNLTQVLGGAAGLLRLPYTSNPGTSDADKAGRTCKIGLWYPRLNNGSGAYLSWGGQTKAYTKVDPETVIHGQKVPAISDTVHEIRTMTKTAYDALVTKDANTLYLTRDA